MKKLILISLSAIVISVSSDTLAAGKDPRTRDEDISATTVSVSYQRSPAGGYEYEYAITSPGSNKGRILTFTVDASCQEVTGVQGVEVEKISGGNFGVRSRDGKHVAATVRADYGQAALFGVSRDNEAKWVVSLNPGETAKGLKITSPYPPATRTYRLVPSMDNDPSWNYPETPDPSIPWIDDFTVTGITTGPACPNSNGRDDAKPFLGSAEAPRQNDATNSLLSYTGIERNRLHTTEDSIDIEVHYSPNIDPETFQVEPASMRYLFRPVPGSSNKVRIPLQQARTALRLKVLARSPHPDSEGDRVDVDHFEFRHHEGERK